MAGIVFGCLSPHPPLIVPGVGNETDRSVVASTIAALEELKDILLQSRPQAAVIVSPHSYYVENSAMGISGASVSEGSLSEWGSTSPKVKFENDLAIVELIQKEAREAKIPLKSIGQRGYNLDHGVMVPIHFFKAALKGLPLVPVTFSWLPLKTHFLFGKAIAKAAVQSNKRVAFIASGDMSHHLKGSGYGHDAMGEAFDGTMVKALSLLNTEAILNLDTEMIDRAGECGLRSVAILLGALDGLKVKPRVISYEGPFGVGYLVASFEVEE
jgi:MEMO1 family protein